MRLKDCLIYLIIILFFITRPSHVRVLYACRLCVSELINLSYYHINLANEYIRIHDKGAMDEVAMDCFSKLRKNTKSFLLKKWLN